MATREIKTCDKCTKEVDILVKCGYGKITTTWRMAPWSGYDMKNEKEIELCSGCHEHIQRHVLDLLKGL